MRETAVSGDARSLESEEDSWHERFARHPVETGGLLGLAVEQLAGSDKGPLKLIGATSAGRLVDALPVPVLLIDRSLRVVFCQPGMRRDGSGVRGHRGLPCDDDVS